MSPSPLPPPDLPKLPQPERLDCHGCGHSNSEQAFCGQCGKPLALQDFLQTCVRDTLKDVVRDKNLVEMDVFYKVAERLFTWARIAVATLAVVLAPIAFIGIEKWSDLYTTIDREKSSIASTSEASQNDIRKSTAEYRKGIQSATDSAQMTIESATKQAVSKSATVERSAAAALGLIESSSLRLEDSVTRVNSQLQTAQTLKQEVTQLRNDLAGARKEIEEQQKVLLNQELFVKNIFSSHRFDVFDANSAPAIFRIVPTPPKGAIIYMLLSHIPVAETVQIQYHIFSQPRTSYVVMDNLVYFVWSDSVKDFLPKQLTVSYFPDKTRTQLLKSIREKDGRIYVDDEPFPKVGPDPDYKGNKWFMPGKVL